MTDIISNGLVNEISPIELSISGAIDYILETATEDDIHDLLLHTSHKSWINFKTNNLNKMRMLEYLKLHIEDITLEDLENIIKNK